MAKKPVFTLEGLRTNLFGALEKLYEGEREARIEALHNALVAQIESHQTPVEDTLYALRLIEFELLKTKYDALFHAER